MAILHSRRTTAASHANDRNHGRAARERPPRGASDWLYRRSPEPGRKYRAPVTGALRTLLTFDLPMTAARAVLQRARAVADRPDHSNRLERHRLHCAVPP